jgi:NAD+ kinase
MAGGEFRRVGVAGHPRHDGLRSIIGQLQGAAERYGAEILVEEQLAPFAPGTRVFDPAELDLLITLGGDGTLLRGARILDGSTAPLFGINLGYLGFLTSAAVADLSEALAALFEGEYWLDVRSTLDVCVGGADGLRPDTFNALNDVVLHKGGFARVIRLLVHVGPDRQELGSYSADGIILSTPTGSTAYSLSAGGPIVDPTLDCIIATPICPHTLVVRPIVLPMDTEIEVTPDFGAGEVILTVDGQDGAQLRPGDHIRVCRGRRSVPLIRLTGQNFFDTLRMKLHWGLEYGSRGVKR